MENKSFQITDNVPKTTLTVKEFCRKYDCDYSAVYRKIKKKFPMENDHIKVIKGVIHLDKYAEDILKPGIKQQEIKQLISKGKSYEWDIERKDGLILIAKTKRKEAEERAEMLHNKLDEREAIIEKLTNELNNIRETNSELMARISELEQKIEGYEKKHKSLFGRWK